MFCLSSEYHMKLYYSDTQKKLRLYLFFLYSAAALTETAADARGSSINIKSDLAAPLDLDLPGLASLC